MTTTNEDILAAPERGFALTGDACAGRLAHLCDANYYFVAQMS